MGDQVGKHGETLTLPLHLMLPQAFTSFTLIIFLLPPGELTRHQGEHPHPSSPLEGPASSSGITPERNHLSLSPLGEAKIPRDDFASSSGWVCSFLSTA